MTPASAHPFDLLQFNGTWEHDLHLAVFGGVARLSVDADADGPERWQRLVFDQFMAVEAQLAPGVLAALSAYCASLIAGIQPRSSTDLHSAETVAALLAQLRPQAVHIGYVESVPWRVGLLYDCDWDPGHGLGVRIVDGRVAEVGSQDICL